MIPTDIKRKIEDSRREIASNKNKQSHKGGVVDVALELFYSRKRKYNMLSLMSYLFS
jgi:hypothetical protein